MSSRSSFAVESSDWGGMRSSLVTSTQAPRANAGWRTFPFTSGGRLSSNSTLAVGPRADEELLHARESELGPALVDSPHSIADSKAPGLARSSGAVGAVACADGQGEQAPTSAFRRTE